MDDDIHTHTHTGRGSYFIIFYSRRTTTEITHVHTNGGIIEARWCPSKTRGEVIRHLVVGLLMRETFHTRARRNEYEYVVLYIAGQGPNIINDHHYTHT